MAKIPTWAWVAGAGVAAFGVGALVLRKDDAGRAGAKAIGIALDVVKKHPKMSVEDQTTMAYHLAHPECPRVLDPKNIDHEDCIGLWVSMRDYVRDARDPDRARKLKNIDLGNLFPEKTADVPFAEGDPEPMWPIPETTNPKQMLVNYRATNGVIVGNGSRRFLATRKVKDKKTGEIKNRLHVGHDVTGNPGDTIVACEDGVIVNIYFFYHSTWCVIVQCDSGLVINYGEVRKGSWEEFGLDVGSRVSKGQPIAKVGLMDLGGHMLHFETYTQGVKRNIKIRGKIDSRIRNPTAYILQAKKLFTGQPLASTTEPAKEGAAPDFMIMNEEQEPPYVSQADHEELVDGP